MLTAAALVPGAPLVVPALSGPGATDVIELRTSTLDVARRLADTAQQWIAVGVGSPDTAEVHRGTFAGFGVDEWVSLRPGDTATAGDAPAAMSTPMLVAGWIRGRVAPEATVCPTLVRASASVSECGDIGAALGQRLADTDVAVGLLVVGDGSFGLSARAPGGAIDGSVAEQDRIDEALATGDLAVIEALDPSVCDRLGIAGRAAWQVAAAIWRSAVGSGTGSPVAESLYCAAPFGVGYQVAWWSR